MKKTIALLLLFSALWMFSGCTQKPSVQTETIYTITVFGEEISDMKIYPASKIIERSQTHITFIEYPSGKEISTHAQEIWVHKHEPKDASE